MKKNKKQDQARRGALMADIFGLKRDPENSQRWQTVWGSKTDLGLFNTAKRILLDKNF